MEKYPVIQRNNSIKKKVFKKLKNIDWGEG